MLIHDVKFNTKDDQILQNYTQETSTSSKCDSVLDTLLIMLWSWKSAYNSSMTYNVDLWCKILYQRWSKTPARTINILKVWLCSSSTYKHVRELNFDIRLNNDIWWYLWCHIWYQIWPNPPNLQSGTMSILQVWLCSWWTSIYARELKIGIQLKNGILLRSMTLSLTPKMTQSSRSPIRNYQCPPSMTIFLMHL